MRKVGKHNLRNVRIKLVIFILISIAYITGIDKLTGIMLPDFINKKDSNKEIDSSVKGIFGDGRINSELKIVDLEGKTDAQLDLIKNEILSKYGILFEGTRLKTFYEKREIVKKELSQDELRVVNMIEHFQNKLKMESLRGKGSFPAELICIDSVSSSSEFNDSIWEIALMLERRLLYEHNIRAVKTKAWSDQQITNLIKNKLIIKSKATVLLMISANDSSDDENGNENKDEIFSIEKIDDFRVGAVKLPAFVVKIERKLSHEMTRELMIKIEDALISRIMRYLY